MTDVLKEQAAVRLLAVSPWDGVAVALGVLHGGLVVALIVAFPWLSGPVFVVLALLYAVSIAWSIHSVAHNFIHNPFFSVPILNRAFSLLLSLTLGYSQGLSRNLHLRHHIGNSDRPNDRGETKDPLSIYRHGRDGAAEPVLRYSVLGFFRTDLREALDLLGRTAPVELYWTWAELVLVPVAVAVFYDPWAIVALLPFWFLGHVLSALTNYYEHLGADPKRPIAWGVSSYGRFYNWLFLNNGHHAEHHFRTRLHWSELPALHQRLAAEQQAAGVRVLAWPHPLGFLERS